MSFNLSEFPGIPEDLAITAVSMVKAKTTADFFANA
jgi:hypothetical protein